MWTTKDDIHYLAGTHLQVRSSDYRRRPDTLSLTIANSYTTYNNNVLVKGFSSLEKSKEFAESLAIQVAYPAPQVGLAG